MKNYGITANIYRDNYNSDLNKFHSIKTVIVPTEEGVFNPSEDCPAVKLVKRQIRPNEPPYIHAEPLEKLDGEYFAFGGSFIYCSDSRFPTRYPIPLHDRRMNLER